MYHATLRGRERAHYGVIPDLIWVSQPTSPWIHLGHALTAPTGLSSDKKGRVCQPAPKLHPPSGWGGRRKQHWNGSQIECTNTLGNIHNVVKGHFISSLTRPLFYLRWIISTSNLSIESALLMSSRKRGWAASAGWRGRSIAAVQRKELCLGFFSFI